MSATYGVEVLAADRGAVAIRLPRWHSDNLLLWEQRRPIGCVRLARGSAGCDSTAEEQPYRPLARPPAALLQLSDDEQISKRHEQGSVIESGRGADRQRALSP